MEMIYAGQTISISEFKRNPAQALRVAGDQPVAVLSHNRPAFYMVPPKLFQRLMEEAADHDLIDVVRERLTRRHTAIDVEIDQL